MVANILKPIRPKIKRAMLLRFDNRQVLLEMDAVLAVIDEMVKGRK